jgi:hypothetical protein
VDNFHRVVAKIAAGAPVRLVEGPDDVCAPMLSSPDSHCRTGQVAGRDQRALADLSALLGEGLLSGELAPGAMIELGPERIALLGAAFARGEIRGACAGCEWHALCSRIAADRFV